MDFVFDRKTEGSVIKNLTVVDNATHEAAAIVSERAISGNALTRILDQVSKDGRYRDKYLNEHWFTSLKHTKVLIEGRRREYKEERPKRSL